MGKAESAPSPDQGESFRPQANKSRSETAESPQLVVIPAREGALYLKEIDSRIIGSNQREIPDHFSSLDVYFGQLKALGLLESEDETTLAQLIETGNEANERLKAAKKARSRDELQMQELSQRSHNCVWARELFMVANLGLVISIAQKFEHKTPKHVGLEELIQYGNEGLPPAVEKFDWRLGFKFSTYASNWIYQSIRRRSPEARYAIKRPVQVEARQRSVRAARSRLLGELEEEPTLEKIAAAAKITPEEAADAFEHDHAMVSIDKPVTDEPSAASLENFLPDRQSSPEESAVEADLWAKIWNAVDTVLEPMEADIIKCRYGPDTESATLTELGIKFNYCRETIRKAEKRALHKLKEELESSGFM